MMLTTQQANFLSIYYEGTRLATILLLQEVLPDIEDSDFITASELILFLEAMGDDDFSSLMLLVEVM